MYVDEKHYNETFMCVNKSQNYVDAMGYMGGMYMSPNTTFSLNGIPNKFTGDYSCPQHFTQVETALGGCGDTGDETIQHVCYNASMPTSLSTIGGFYVVNHGSMSCEYPVENPYTNAASCPVGFTAYPTMDFCCVDTGLACWG